MYSTSEGRGAHEVRYVLVLWGPEPINKVVWLRLALTKHHIQFVWHGRGGTTFPLPEFPTTVLNLTGLWGSSCSMRKFIGKAVLYPARVIPCGIHGRGDGLQKFQVDSMEWWMDSMEWGDGFHGMGDGFHTFGGWIPWFFHMDSMVFPHGFHTFSIWNPAGISSWNHQSTLMPWSSNLNGDWLIKILLKLSRLITT